MLDKIKTHNQPRILLQLKEFLQKVHYQLNQLFEIETFFCHKKIWHLTYGGAWGGRGVGALEGYRTAHLLDSPYTKLPSSSPHLPLVSLTQLYSLNTRLQSQISKDREPCHRCIWERNMFWRNLIGREKESEPTGERTKGHVSSSWRLLCFKDTSDTTIILITNKFHHHHARLTIQHMAISEIIDQWMEKFNKNIAWCFSFLPPGRHHKTEASRRGLVG